MDEQKSEAKKPSVFVSDLLYGIAGWLLVGLGGIGILSTILRFVGETAPTNIIASAVVVGLSVVAIAFGLLVNPRFRNR